jgi:hypothetical protein
VDEECARLVVQHVVVDRCDLDAVVAQCQDRRVHLVGEGQQVQNFGVSSRPLDALSGAEAFDVVLYDEAHPLAVRGVHAGDLPCSQSRVPDDGRGCVMVRRPAIMTGRHCQDGRSVGREAHADSREGWAVGLQLSLELARDGVGLSKRQVVVQRDRDIGLEVVPKPPRPGVDHLLDAGHVLGGMTDLFDNTGLTPSSMRVTTARGVATRCPGWRP